MTAGDGAWEAISYEERFWSPAADVRDSFSPHLAASGPYRASVPPFIADLPVELDADTRSRAHDATSELIRLDAELGRGDSPRAPLLLRAECAASSAIEHVTAPALAIMLADIDESLEPHALQIVAHVKADQAALARAGALDEDAIVHIQRTLMASTRPDRRGRWRSQQIWIGGGSRGPQRASFVPPHESRVPALMADLVAFMKRRDLPPLPQIAIAHAQYETIHPFLEVNGRTGRAVLQAMLRRSDITRSVVLPLSTGLLQDTAGYFNALTRYRAGHISDVVDTMSRAAHTAVATSRVLLDDLDSIEESWQAQITARQGSAARRLLDLLARQPALTSRLAVSHLGVSAPNALLAIDRLVDDGILSQVGSGRRNRTWVAHDVLRALDALAERARRQR
ncbi:Fic family protein [Microbacterium sp. 1.5R]|uniref:Fic family protein n=1 Tax=Microbacterium sp. 1.5R TaxID=1916917 RepID=UPI00119FA6B1|nr:Fic family protein [Microbacterium sp. 1.5R]